MKPENSIKVAPENTMVDVLVREEFPVKYERWRMEREDKAIEAVEEANLPERRVTTQSQWEGIHLLKERNYHRQWTTALIS